MILLSFDRFRPFCDRFATVWGLIVVCFNAQSYRFDPALARVARDVVSCLPYVDDTPGGQGLGAGCDFAIIMTDFLLKRLTSY